MRQPLVIYDLVPHVRPVADVRMVHQGDLFVVHPLTIEVDTWLREEYPDAPRIGGLVAVPLEFGREFSRAIETAGFTGFAI